jgi:hypothetical protein
MLAIPFKMVRSSADCLFRSLQSALHHSAPTPIPSSRLLLLWLQLECGCSLQWDQPPSDGVQRNGKSQKPARFW